MSAPKYELRPTKNGQPDLTRKPCKTTSADFAATIFSKTKNAELWVKYDGGVWMCIGKKISGGALYILQP